MIDNTSVDETLRLLMELVLDAVGKLEAESAMKLFIDTGSVARSRRSRPGACSPGATTNPILLAKEEGDPGDIIRRICDSSTGPPRPRSWPPTPRG